MDLTSYKSEFIAEAKEQLITLNDALLKLEKDHAQEELIHTVFRAFHTIKGNAATMGYQKYAELAHGLEDLLAKIRDKTLTITTEMMNLLFEGCDLLDSGIKLIEQDNAETLNTAGVLAEIHAMLAQKTPAVQVTIAPELELNPEQIAIIREKQGQDLRAYRIIISCDPKNPLKSAKLLLAIKQLEKILSPHYVCIRCTPLLDDIRAGKFTDDVELVIMCKESDKEKIIPEVCSFTGILKCLVLTIAERYERAITPLDQEAHKNAIIEKHQTEYNAQIQSVRVNMDKLDKLMNLVGELLIGNIRLKDIDKRTDLPVLKSVLTEIDRIVIDLKDEVTQIRMIPIGTICSRFPRMVRDLAAKEHKQVNFRIEGEELEFDRTVLDQLGDPLMHLLRNSIDHGIEPSDIRAQHGKSPTGTIMLSARREKDAAIIEVRDDGLGIDPERVKESCISKGILTPEAAQKLSPRELQLLVFKPGVTTNTSITEVSGRGVGMDVVLNSIKSLGGSVDLNSQIGIGTTVTLKLPLTVAIITAFIVRVDDEIYAIPLTSITEAVRILPTQIKTVTGKTVFILRGKELPLVWLADLLALHSVPQTIERKTSLNPAISLQGDVTSANSSPTSALQNSLTVVVVQSAHGDVGIVVDAIIAQQQVLIKTLQSLVKQTKGCAGATIMGDGSVALILDVNTLLYDQTN